MLATTGTMRVVLRCIHIDQSPANSPDRALVPKPPPLGAHGEVQCAGVQCGRSAVFGEGLQAIKSTGGLSVRPANKMQKNQQDAKGRHSEMNGNLST